jgi:DNA (cytosine-5)-methyltransferase 1
LENVCGALTSHDGKDFAAIGEALVGSGYRFGAMVIDAVRFVPQSRPRLFIVGVRQELAIPDKMTADGATLPWHTTSLTRAHRKLPRDLKDAWIWWNPAAPPTRTLTFAEVVDAEANGVEWHTSSETKRLLGMMSRLNRSKVEKAKRAGRRMVGGIYKRMREDEFGQRVQRAELRFDEVSGCLRTPVGGSSRQILMIVEGDSVRSRLLSPREAARLMGLPETYQLPKNYNEAYHLAGDGVVVPVVRFLAAELLEPLYQAGARRRRAAA